MKTLKLAMAGLAALGAALAAAPEPASAGYGGGYGYGAPYYGYYRRPVVKRVVVVPAPYYPGYYRPYRRPIVYGAYGYRPYGWRRGYRW
jgi:hypothetical protein